VNERPLGKPKHRWEGNIKMDLWESGWKVSTSMHLAQDKDQWRAVVNAVMNLRLP